MCDAFENAEYTTAVDRLTKAKEINGEDYVVLNRLAHAYRQLGQTDNAIAAFQEIINTFPGTDQATRAANSIEQLGGTPQDPQDTSDDESDTADSDNPDMADESDSGD